MSFEKSLTSEDISNIQKHVDRIATHRHSIKEEYACAYLSTIDPWRLKDVDWLIRNIEWVEDYSSAGQVSWYLRLRNDPKLEELTKALTAFKAATDYRKTRHDCFSAPEMRCTECTLIDEAVALLPKDTPPLGRLRRKDSFR